MSKINTRTFKFAILLGLSALLPLSPFISSYSKRLHQSPADFVIQHDLELRLRYFSRGPLRVTVAHGSVKLDGRVENPYDHEQIVAIAKEGAGTNRVLDGLAVAHENVHAGDTDERYSAWLHARRSAAASPGGSEGGE